MTEPQQQLLLRYLDGQLGPEEESQLADLLRDDPEARAFLRDVAEQAVVVADLERTEQRRREESETQQDRTGDRRMSPTPGARLARWSWAIAAAAVVVLIATVYSQRPSPQQPIEKIAKITGLSGSLQWTGDGGRVFHDLSVGAELSGGTVEGMAPGSWFELQFNDGSTVTISGNSVLTFSDDGQKKLHLKEGNVSGNVKPQPADRPMLIHTRSAVLEVVGTQFEVQAALAATMVNVSEGKVRVRRLSDGSTVDVLAKQRVIAAADREMLAVPVPDSVNWWKSRLHLGPDGGRGKWSPGTDTEEAKLRAVPYTTPGGVTIYTATVGVSRGDRPPVMLQPASCLRVRGHMGSTHKIYFGVTVRHPNGEFAGRFQTIRPADEFPGRQDFEAILHLRDFRLDSSLAAVKDKLPSTPFDLVVESVWCHTLNDRAGLEITEVELQPTTQPSQLPVMDIWTAASQGNLEVVRRRLADGTDIDASFIALGIPASGATPLHIGVLADQGQIVELLIQKRANLDARAEDQHGGTPLHWAAALGRIEMAKRLIEAGADVNAIDNDGFTPLDATYYDPEFEGKAKREITELLREKGAKRAEEP